MTNQFNITISVGDITREISDDDFMKFNDVLGIKKGNILNWTLIRLVILARDGFRCKCSLPHSGNYLYENTSVCGYRKKRYDENHICNGRNLQVHHMIPRSAGGTDNLDNLITLCSSCHAPNEPDTAKRIKSTISFVRESTTRYLQSRI